MPHITDERCHDDNDGLGYGGSKPGKLDQERQRDGVDCQRHYVDACESREVNNEVVASDDPKREATVQHEGDHNRQHIGEVEAPDVSDDVAEDEVEQEKQAVAHYCVGASDNEESNAFVPHQRANLTLDHFAPSLSMQVNDSRIE